MKAANGSRIEVMGQFETEFLWKNFNGYGSCYVSQEVNDIMGLDWMKKLPQFRKLSTDLENHNISIMSIKKDTDLIKKIKAKYLNIFKNGLGLCKLTKAKLSIKEGAKPVFCKPRKIPYGREQLVEKELGRLINDGVIKKVDFSKWAAPIVAITKANGNIRICADFKTGLNKVFESHTHPLPTPDDIFTKLNGGAWFTQIDFTDAYLQIEVEDKSKELLTITTPKGLFQYERLPFGVKCAPGIFQEAMDNLIAGLKGCAAYLDDVIVTGKTLEEHDENVLALFKRIDEFCFCVKLEKFSFSKREVKFFGNVMNKHGRKPDPVKIQAIINMPAPANKKQIKSFLGMVTYYSIFIQDIRSIRGSLDELETQNEFKWE